MLVQVADHILVFRFDFGLQIELYRFVSIKIEK